MENNEPELPVYKVVYTQEQHKLIALILKGASCDNKTLLEIIDILTVKCKRITIPFDYIELYVSLFDKYNSILKPSLNKFIDEAQILHVSYSYEQHLINALIIECMLSNDIELLILFDKLETTCKTIPIPDNYIELYYELVDRVNNIKKNT